MIITYASAHRWTKPVSPDPMSDFGKNAAARLRATYSRLPDYTISNTVAPLDANFLDWFIPLYETRINEKTNPRVFDIRTKTLGSKNPGKYFSMSLREHDEIVGGTIFSYRDGKMSIAYRTYANTWINANLPANPSAYTEFLINQYAVEVGAHTIIHGKDRNPYGLNSSIGLANFKLAAGCRPELPKKFEVATIDTDTLTIDALILAYPEIGTAITKAYLVTDEIGRQKWQGVTAYGDRLEIIWLPRKT